MCIFFLSEAYIDAAAQYVLSELKIPGMDGGFAGKFDPNAHNNFERDDF